MNTSLPTRTLREHPDIEQLKRQAKELLEAFLAGEQEAVAEVNAHFRPADSAKFALHDAQLVLARAYGFDSWPKLKAYIDGANARRLVEAVRADDMAQVSVMLKARPELANSWIDNLQALHYAVFNRSPEMVRLLMQHGANARQGVYPHNEATNPLRIAVERRYDEIAAIIREEEQRRREAKSGVPGAPLADELAGAIQSGDDERAVAIMQENPALIHMANLKGWTPLHAASWILSEPLVTWLLQHGADPNARGHQDWTPLDAAASRFARGSTDYGERFKPIAERLQRGGAASTPRAAVALGDADWIRARHAEGTLPGPLDAAGGLLRIAVTHDRPEMLALLLDLGLDPDERVRVPGVDSVEYTWGFPLWECAATGQHEMAEMLLKRGADPNAMVYASGTPVHQAYGQRDQKMIELLERYGGLADAGLAALHRMTDLAKRRFEEAADKPKVAQDLVWGGACGGDLEIVRFALPLVDLPRDDPRWFGALEAPLRLWNHGPGHWCHHEWDRGTYLECFRWILKRCDPNLRGREPDKGQSGFTILHIVTGGRVEWMTKGEQVEFATALLDAGARLDIRDNLLKSTPLGWACRWGRVELVKLFLARGADPVEADAEPWATPQAWAQKMKHEAVLAILREHGRA